MQTRRRNSCGYPGDHQAGPLSKSSGYQAIPGLLQIYDSMEVSVGTMRMLLNTDWGAHFLDREIIDTYCRVFALDVTSPLQTVRGSFAEGAPIYPGSKILHKAHTQIAVRDTASILRVSLVQFP